MVTQDQTAIIDFLMSPSTHGGASVERIDTHSAVVCLAGARVYKLKRAVRFDYLDFSTSDLRKAFCDAEVRLNTRTAPDLYRGVLPITRDSGGTLALGGPGTPIDWVVEMNRFPQEALFDRLAAAGRLDLDLMPPLADAVAALHDRADVRLDHGGRDAMAWVIDGNASGFEEFGRACLDPADCARVTGASRRELERQAALLDARRAAGRVRQCHGDLHLRNIVLVDGRPVLFDGIEFNDRLSCTDVVYDMAFLLMDLWRRRLPRHANAVWNRYLFDTGDLDGLPLLPLSLSCRAAVRAKTSATAAALQGDGPRQRDLHEMARDYLAMAERLLHPPPPCLIAVGGFSGSGKSVLARSLAPGVGSAPGACLVRSDEIRKQLSGVSPLERLGPEGYTPEMSARVYDTMAERAGRIVRAGHAAIVDGVHARPEDRGAIERVAAEAHVPFVGLWLDAPASTLISRVEQRRDDASDAGADAVRMQLGQQTGDIGWHRLDASVQAEDVLRKAADLASAYGVRS